MIDILPHEPRLLDHLRTKIAKKQAQLATEKGEAQGDSYDWHDNAPLDVVEDELRFLNNRMSDAEGLIKDSEIVGYPDPSDIRVRLGSLVVAKVRSGSMPFVLVGQNATGAEEYTDAWSEDHPKQYEGESLNVITPLSPIGAAALNASLGQEICYKVGDRTMSATIEHVDQQWVRSHFSDQEQPTV